MSFVLQVKTSDCCLYCCCLVAQLCLTLYDYGLLPARLLCPCGFPGKNIGAGCHFFHQGIFPTQGSNLHLLHWKAESLPLHHQGSPTWWDYSGDSEGKGFACNEGDLGWEDPLEEDMATHSSILVWRIPMDRGAWRATVHGIAKSWMWLND